MIDRLLTFDPNKRITAEEALQHPWITGANHASGPRNSTNLAPVIRKGYSSRGSLTAIALLNQFKDDDDSTSDESIDKKKKNRKSVEVKDLDIN